MAKTLYVRFLLLAGMVMLLVLVSAPSHLTVSARLDGQTDCDDIVGAGWVDFGYDCAGNYIDNTGCRATSCVHFTNGGTLSTICTIKVRYRMERGCVE